MKKNILDRLVRCIEEDRDTVTSLINDLKTKILAGKANHQDVGDVMAKYMLASVRNNEQLTNVYTAIVKAEKPSDKEQENIGEEDLNKIFENIQDERNASKDKKN